MISAYYSECHTKYTQLAQDPVFLIMLFIVASIVRDSFGICFLLASIALAKVIYKETATSHNPSNTLCSGYKFLRLTLVFAAVILWIFCAFSISTLQLPYDKVFEVNIAETKVRVFPGWLFLTCYAFPILGRRIIDGDLSLLREMRFTARDCLFVVLLWIPITLSSLSSLPKQGPNCWLLGLAAFYIPGLWEELCFRGLLLYSLLYLMRRWLAILVSALIFAAHHRLLLLALVRTPSLFIMGNLISIIALGILLGWVYARTRRLSICMLIHGGLNGLAYLCSALGLKPIVLPTQWLF